MTIEHPLVEKLSAPHLIHQTTVEDDLSEIEPEKGVSRNPLKIKNIVLEEDFYALTWISLKWDIWESKKIRGEDIFLGPADFFWIHMNFIFFLCSLVVTIWLILIEIIEDREYTASNITIIILRVTLVCFAQRSLAPEFFQGLFLIRYSTRNPDQFSHYQFAVFVGACQFIVSCTCFLGIMLFVCTAEEALSLVVEFAGLSIIAKLDNWIGDAIMLSKTRLEEKEDEVGKFNLTNINIRMSLTQKMSLVEEHDLILQDDQNEIKKSHWSLRAIDWIINLCPWLYVLAFLTLIFNFVMPLITHYAGLGEKKHE
jgi:hypothetical protein